MTFEEAKTYPMPWGKYKGRQLDAIAQDKEGLEYLDWLRGVRAEDGKDDNIDRFIGVFLSDPSIRKEIGT